MRGSSKRRDLSALRSLIREIRSGRETAIVVDGPRGPLHEVKGGALFLAARLQVPVIPVAAAARRYRTLEGSWKKTVLPAPFTKTVILHGEPVWVTAATEAAIEDGRLKLQDSLRRLTAAAERMAADPPAPRPVRMMFAVSAAARYLWTPLQQRRQTSRTAQRSRLIPPNASAPAPSRSHRSPDR